MAALDDLEARVAALEASRADYGAVLAAVNALGANQRELAMNQREHTLRIDGLEREMRAGFRTVDERLAELKDLIIEGRNRG